MKLHADSILKLYGSTLPQGEGELVNTRSGWVWRLGERNFRVEHTTDGTWVFYGGVVLLGAVQKEIERQLSAVPADIAEAAKQIAWDRTDDLREFLRRAGAGEDIEALRRRFEDRGGGI